MFEHSTLSSGPASKRLWATCAGFAGEAILVIVAILAPMVFPQVLPRMVLVTSLLPPVPPGRPKADPERPRTPQARVRPVSQFHMGAIIIPTSIPAHAAILVDPPPDVPTGEMGVPGGLDTGGAGAGNGILRGVMGSIGAPPPRPIITDTIRPAETPAPPIKRVRQGGLVKQAALLHRIDPVYPPIARQMRVSGTVELQGVIGTDGHIRELRVVSGHPLLTHAALEAVSQWIYAPTLLNGELVEVVTSITVTFHMN